MEPGSPQVCARGGQVRAQTCRGPRGRRDRLAPSDRVRKSPENAGDLRGELRATTLCRREPFASADQVRRRIVLVRPRRTSAGSPLRIDAAIGRFRPLPGMLKGIRDLSRSGGATGVVGCPPRWAARSRPSTDPSRPTRPSRCSRFGAAGVLRVMGAELLHRQATSAAGLGCEVSPGRAMSEPVSVADRGVEASPLARWSRGPGDPADPPGAGLP